MGGDGAGLPLGFGKVQSRPSLTRSATPGTRQCDSSSAHSCAFEMAEVTNLATAAAIDRGVHHSVILEFDISSYRTDAVQQSGEAT